MKRFSGINLFFCGILLTFAAFPVFAQKDQTQKGEARKTDDVRINKQPLQDWSGFLRDKLEKGELDPAQPFKIVADISLDKDGRMDLSIDQATKQPKTRYVSTEGEEQMVIIAKSAVEAIGNSGWFAHLKQFGVDKFKLTLGQDKEKFFGGLEIEQPTKEKAGTTVSAFNMLFLFVKTNAKLDEDAKTILSGFEKVTSSEKVVMINFELPAEKVREIIQRNLQKAAEPQKW